jgi:hypothetical protein
MSRAEWPPEPLRARNETSRERGAGRKAGEKIRRRKRPDVRGRGTGLKVGEAALCEVMHG